MYDFNRCLKILWLFLYLFMKSCPQNYPVIFNAPSPSVIQSNQVNIEQNTGGPGNRVYNIIFDDTIQNPKLILCMNKLQIASGNFLFAKFYIQHSSLTTSGFTLTLFVFGSIIIYESTVQYIVFNSNAELISQVLGLSVQKYQRSTNLQSVTEENITITLSNIYSQPTARTQASNTKIKCLNFIHGLDLTVTLSQYSMRTNCQDIAYNQNTATLNVKIMTNNFNGNIYGNLVLFRKIDGPYFGYFNQYVWLVAQNLVNSADNLAFTSVEQEIEIDYFRGKGIDPSLSSVWMLGLGSLHVRKNTEKYSFESQLNSLFQITVTGVNQNNAQNLETNNFNSAHLFYISQLSCTNSSLYYSKIHGRCYKLGQSCDAEGRSAKNMAQLNHTQNIFWLNQTRNTQNQWISYDTQNNILFVQGSEIMIIDLEDQDRQTVHNTTYDQINLTLSTNLRYIAGTQLILIADVVYKIVDSQDATISDSLTPMAKLFDLPSNQIIQAVYASQTNFYKPSNITHDGFLILMENTGNILVYSDIPEQFSNFITETVDQNPIYIYEGLRDDILSQNDINSSVLNSSLSEQLATDMSLIFHDSYLQPDNSSLQIVLVQVILGNQVIIYEIELGESGVTNWNIEKYQSLQMETNVNILSVSTNVASPDVIDPQHTFQEYPLKTITTNCLKPQYLLNRFLYIYILTQTDQMYIYRALNARTLNNIQTSANYQYLYQKQDSQYLISDISGVNSIFTDSISTFVSRNNGLKLDMTSNGQTLAIITDTKLLYIFRIQYQSHQDCMTQYTDDDICLNAGNLPGYVSQYLSYKYEVVDIRDMGMEIGENQQIRDIAINSGNYKISVLTQNALTQLFNIYTLECYIDKPSQQVCPQYASVVQIIDQTPIVVPEVNPSQSSQTPQAQTQVQPQTQPQIQPQVSPQVQPQVQPEVEPQAQTEPEANNSENQGMSDQTIAIIGSVGGLGAVAIGVAVYQLCFKNPANSVKVNPAELTRGSMYNTTNFTKTGENMPDKSDSLVEFSQNIETQKTLNKSHRLRSSDMNIENIYERGLIRQKSNKMMIIEDIQ